MCCMNIEVYFVMFIKRYGDFEEEFYLVMNQFLIDVMKIWEIKWCKLCIKDEIE